MKKSKQNAEHYKWGADCDGWKLVQQQGRSIIHERMPPLTAETRHYHALASQFFFILKGEAVMEIEGIETVLYAQEGIEVAPGSWHQIHNRSHAPVEFLVISTPSTQGDRVEEER